MWDDLSEIARRLAAESTCPEDAWTLDVKMEHVEIIAWIWHEIVPLATGWPLEYIAETWAIFRADPMNDSLDVLGMRNIVRIIWQYYVTLS